MDAPLEANECALTARKYKVAASVGLVPDFMITTPLLVDTGATMNLTHHQFIPARWRSAIQPYMGSQVKSANESLISITGVIRLLYSLRKYPNLWPIWGRGGLGHSRISGRPFHR